MPGFDRTGPLGQGSITGRGFGPCGMGLGWRRRFKTKKDLADYRKCLEEELKDVKKEIEELNA